MLPFSRFKTRSILATINYNRRKDFFNELSNFLLEFSSFRSPHTALIREERRDGGDNGGKLSDLEQAAQSCHIASVKSRWKQRVSQSCSISALHIDRIKTHEGWTQGSFTSNYVWN